MGLTENERAELHVLAANVRDDRLRGLVFKLLEATHDDRAVPKKHDDDDRAVPKKHDDEHTRRHR